MASKTFSNSADTTGNTAGYDPGTYKLALKVTATYDEDNSRIKVTYTATYTAVVGAYYFNNGNNIAVYINGSAVYNANPGSMQLSQGSSKTLCTGTKYIPVTTSGSVKITCYAKFTQSQASCFNITTNTSGYIKVEVGIDGWPSVKVYLRVGGAWKAVTPYVRVNDAWKKVGTTYLRLDG